MNENEVKRIFQIAEMEKGIDLGFDIAYKIQTSNFTNCIAETLFEKGYRKESDTARDIISEAKKWVKEHHKDKITDSFGEREMLFMEAFGCLLSCLMEKYVLEGKENGRID